ncbi:protein of unknown function [Aminobacter niigataensis]|nr:protein of unknown function [Aminobacter niigataensis]
MISMHNWPLANQSKETEPLGAENQCLIAINLRRAEVIAVSTASYGMGRFQARYSMPVATCVQVVD